MAKTFAVCLLAFAVLFAFNHTAYAGPDGEIKITAETREALRKLIIRMNDVQAKCAACQSLADAYNKTKAAADELDEWIEDIEDEISSNRRADERVHEEASTHDTGEGMTEGDKQAAAEEMNYRMTLDDMREKLPAMEEQRDRLDALAKDLKAQLAACEAEKCVLDEGGGHGIKTGGDAGGGGKMRFELPFDWRGPYPPVCFKCEKLAERLNALPNMAREEMSKIEVANARKQMAEMRIRELQGEHMGFPGGFGGREHGEKRTLGDAETKRLIKEKQDEIEQAEKDIKEAQKELANYKRNFEQTLKLYNDCVPTCPKQTGMVEPEKDDTALALGGDYSKDLKGVTCEYAALPDHFLIGPNSQYGSGAAMKDKAKSMAGSLLGSAIGGLGGGGGMKFGGGGGMMDDRIGTESTGGGGSDKGPPTEKDPTKGKWDDFSVGGFDMGYRFLPRADNGLTISAKIEDAPGDGTFHASFLQDGKGHTITPKDFHVYSLYYDWKLTVWWTHDRWVDGEHVLHESGEEVTTGRNTVGNWKVYDKAENSIWGAMGFGNASKGIRGLGLDYDLSKLDLSCPLKLTNYITEPKQDPVTASPVSVMLDRMPGKNDELFWTMVRGGIPRDDASGRPGITPPPPPPP